MILENIRNKIRIKRKIRFGIFNFFYKNGKIITKILLFTEKVKSIEEAMTVP